MEIGAYKNIGPNERYVAEGFESLRTALVRVKRVSAYWRRFGIPNTQAEQITNVQAGIARYPEYLSAMVLSCAVGRKALLDSPVVQRVSRTFVDDRCHCAGMTALKLVDGFILQVDPLVVGLPAFVANFASLDNCLSQLGLTGKDGHTVATQESELYFLQGDLH